jgi:hypothetical protein
VAKDSAVTVVIEGKRMEPRARRNVAQKSLLRYSSSRRRIRTR